MDQAQGLPIRERFKLAFEKFLRAHVVDDDPYDAFENEQFESLIRQAQAAEKHSAKNAAEHHDHELPLAA